MGDKTFTIQYDRGLMEYAVPTNAKGSFYFTQDEPDAINTLYKMHGHDAKFIIREYNTAPINR